MTPLVLNPQCMKPHGPKPLDKPCNKTPFCNRNDERHIHCFNYNSKPTTRTRKQPHPSLLMHQQRSTDALWQSCIGGSPCLP
mmetsp:Transcript_18588/g.53594  ORF Transcript_18588/g.53594 Transcript_18588/m.53594 type:complete len:82 (-) Transcript_18588:331-576(-)